MSRVTARQGIAAYLTNASVPNVGTVYPARPTILQEDAYVQKMTGEAISQTENGSSAVLVVNMVRSQRQRRALTGRDATNDTLIHSVDLEVFFASYAGKGVEGQYDYDGITDAITDLVRADPTFGGSLWSAGEYTSGVDHRQGEPFLAPGGAAVMIVGAISFEAWEWVNGPVSP